MQPRQIALVAAVVVLGFLAAFGIAKAAGGGEDAATTGSPGQPAEVFKIAPVEVAAGAPPAGSLPSLKVPKPKPTSTPEPSTPTEPAPAPTTAPVPAPTTAPVPAPTTAPAPAPTAAPQPTIQQGGGGIQQGGSD
jgi:outer membrane biosynthesis protein TonB